MTPEESGVWLFEYYPRPGEKLHLSIARPTPVPGATVAFDRVQLETRSSDTSLTLNYRGLRPLGRPPQAQARPYSDALQPEHDELSLSALPGVHSWKNDTNSSAWPSLPAHARQG